MKISTESIIQIIFQPSLSLYFYQQHYYESIHSATEAVKDGDAWGVVYFPVNYTDELVARMYLGKAAEQETLDGSEIRVWLDMSSKY